MTDARLDEIEAALGVTLPAEYRQVSRAFPFRQVGRDRVYWFFDDPQAVIHGTRYPHEDGAYAGPELLPRYVAIGDSASGDAYLLDLDTVGLPVVCLSHETHAIEPEYPTLMAFVDEWVRFPEEMEGRAAADREALRAWWRRAFIVAGVIALFAFVIPLLVLCLAPRR